MKNSMNQKNRFTKSGAQETRGKAKSTMSPCPASRRTDKLTSGGSTNSHSRRGIFGAFLSVLMASIMITSFAIGAYADNTTNVNNGGTTPVDEYDGTHNIYTVHDNTAAVTGDTTVPTPYNVSNVVQSRSTNSATTFAAGLPLSTIYIDQSKIAGDANAKSCTFQALPGPYSSAITRDAGSGLVTYDAQTGPKQIKGGEINTLDGPLFYVEFQNAAILPNGDTANLRATYSDARIVVDQRYAAGTYQGTSWEAASYAGKIRLATGSKISFGGSDLTDITGMYANAGRQEAVRATARSYNAGQTFNSGGFKNPMVGMSIDVTYQIVDNNGTPVPGTFIFAIAGINLDRDPFRGVNAGNNAAKPLWYVNNMPGGSEYHFFSEAMSINSGMASDNIYVRSNDNGDIGDDNKETPWTAENPGKTNEYQAKRINQTNFWPQVTTDSNGNTKFIGNAEGNRLNSRRPYDDSQGSDTAYSNGFVTLADAAAGFKVTATGHGGGSSYNMNTTTFVSATIWYRYTSGSGNHGKIELTNEGNPGGTLSTGSVLDGGKNPYASDATSSDKPNVYVVTEGKTVTYTMTPDIGYQIKKLTVNGKEVKLTNGALQDVDLSQMKRGDTVTVETNDYNYWENPDTLEARDPSKGQGLLTYNADGTYTFTFNHAKADEEIFVEWEPVTADILTYKIWDDNNDKDGIRYNADTNNTLPKFKLQYSLNGRTWNDVTTTVNIGNQTYTLKKPVTEQTVPAGKDNNNKYVDGTYVINNDPNKNSNDPDVKKHPFTWEHLPVYTYDSNGTAGKAIQYRIVEVNDPWHSEYNEAEYYDLEVFDLTSDKVKSIDGWSIYTDGTTYYVQKADGKYYEVNMTDGSVATSPAANQPDPDNLDPYADSNSWTVDKAIPYQESQVKNTHFTTEYFVEVTKKWDDEALLGKTTTSGTNQYARKDIFIVLHGETEGGTVVDLNGSEAGTDLKKEIKTTELELKANVTGNKTIDNFTIYKSGSSEYALVEGYAPYADGYYTVSGNVIDYTSGAVTPTPTGLTVVKKGDGTYQINDNDFGAMFEDLPTHYNGKEITYTVKETDTSGNDLTEWIMTGGQLKAVTDDDKNVLGYETTMRNTPDVDEIYTKVPLTLIKRDVNDSDSRLEGAEFTIYTDAVVGDKASQSDKMKVGEKVYTKTEEDETTGTQVTTNYVIRKDANDNDQYKYYEVTSGDTVSPTPANPQPISLDLTESGLLGGGEDAYTDGTKTYVLRSGGYHLVNTDGSIAAAPVKPQPDANLIKAAKDETTGAVKENVVTTNSDGEAYVSFLKTGTYYIKETKAPTGYNVDPTTYAFKVDAELKSITLQSADGEHTTPWWKKLYDLIFGNSGVSYDNWAPNADKKGGTLTVDDTPIVADVLVRKYWNDNDNQDGKRPGDKNNPSSTDDSALDPEFKLPTVTLQYTTGAHTATGLNVYTDGDATNPKKYVLKNNEYYEVTAEDVNGEYQSSAAATQPTGATATSETCKGLTVYKDSNNKKYVIVDNVYYEVDEVDKVGAIASTPAATQPDENLLSLVMDGRWTTVKVKDDNDNLVDAKNKVNYVGGPVLTHQNDAYTWNDLPAYRDGKLVTYRILEEDDPSGNILTNHIYDIESNHTSQTHDKTFHLANTSGQTPTALNQTVDVTNRHDTQVINIEVYKEWEDEDPDDRSASTIRLYKVVNGIETVVSKGTGDETQEDTGTVPVEDKTDAIKVWKDLPTYEGGYPVTYRLKEEAIEGYNTHYTAVYKKTDDTDVDTETQDILAEDIKRTFYAQGDTLPDGKKVGDENTTARFEILNERSVNVKVSKTWRKGANANVTYELWRTIKKESELTTSAFTSTPVSDTDDNRYYVRKTIIITAAEYAALSTEEQADYTKRYVNNSDSTDIISVDDYNALDTSDQANYTEKYVNDNHEIITAETYDQMSAEKKAEYEIEATRTWSPYQGGGKDGTTTVDGWELVDSHLFDSNAFDNIATGSTVTHPFNNLDIKDINGNVYLYRVLEKPALNRFRENQISNTEIINNNVNVSDGNVSFEVVKELEGRSWMDKDDFKLYLEAVNGKNVTDPANPVDVAQNMVPMPYRIDPATSKTTYNYTADATKTDLQVGALGRAATFQGIQYKQNSNLYQSIGVGETYEFYYKVYEIYDTKTVKDETNNTETVTKDTGLDEATDHTGTKDGITYDGEVEPGGLLTADKFNPTVHEAKVIVKNVNGNISTEIQWKKNGNYVTGAVPVYTNTYSSKGTAKLWVEKEIKNRAWVDYNNSAKTGDAFEFKIDSISGSQLNVPGSTTSDSYTTKPLMSNAANNPQSDIQKMSDTEYAFGVTGNKYDNTMLNSNGVGYFFYEISEDGKVNYSDDHFNITNYAVDGLNYDPNKKYIRVKAEDNWDGTIRFTIEYFTDASCKTNHKINDYKAWIRDDGTQTNEGKRLLSMTDAAAAEQMTQEQRDAAGYRQVDVAHFINYETIDIPVKKEWTDGPAIEDVNLHLERHLFPISGTGAVDESAINDSYVKTEEAKDVWTEDNPFWQTAGYTHISKRGEFLKDDGTPKYNDDENKSSQTYGDKKNEAGENIDKEDFIDGFNENLPKYVIGDGKNGTTTGVLYRAVYRLYEDDTSNTYTRSYKSINGSTETDDDYIFTDGDTLVVTNKVVATNTANPAAVKQLQGRDWLTGDDFKFTLTPVGKFDKDGTYEETTDIPKPAVITGYVNKEDDADTKTVEEYEALSDEDKASYDAVKETSNEAHAKKDDKVVDPNGNLERLARFGEIAFKTSDLVYHTSDKHYHGDFFYEMKEDIPSTAYAVNKKTGEKVLDGDNEITFDSNFTKAKREQYHWKDDATGITYDGSVHTVHIKVKENRTNELQVQVAYDEEKRGDITTGTQFTPVYTNKYDATVEYAQTINKYIRGRDWKDSDVFDFRMTPLAGAPFEDADKSEFPAQDTHSDDDREKDLGKGDAIHSARGAHVKRLDVSDTTNKIQTLTMPKLEFRLSELGKTVTAENPLYYSDKTTAVPVGMAYDQFVYSFEETNDYLSKADKDVKDLIIDPDTEYARVTVIDKGDGTLDYYTEIFEDRYCKIPRYKPGTEIIDPKTKEVTGGEPAEYPTFVNKLKRELSITKTWVGTATSDVTLRLQWSVNGKNYYNVDEAEWMPAGIRNTQTIGRHDSGTSLTKTWYNLPAYANITDALDQEGDNLDMNDLWVYYRIVEDDIPNVITRYSTAPYEANDDYNNADKYKNKNNAPHTGEEKEEGEYVTNRVTQLYVTNWPEDLKGEANVGIVKQYIGKAWEDEEFEFEIIPIESQIGGETTPVKEGATRKTTVYSKNEGGKETVISKGDYDAITDATEKAKYQAKEVSETNSLPKYNGTNSNKAVARESNDKVSVNERSANFDPLTIKLSDLAIDYSGNASTNSDYGKAKGTFYYKIREVRPPDAEETSEVCGKDADGNNVNYVVGTNNGKKVKYTTEEHIVKIVAVDDGSGSIDVTTSFDNREHGEFVPVYTNYAQLPTPIEGSKTWIGGSADKHINGTVTIENNEITGATDDLKLKLQRKSDKEGSSTETLTTDDSGRELVIVWAQQVDTITSYKLKEGQGDEDDPTTLYVEEYESLDETDKAKYEPLTSKTWVKNETGDGVFTIKAKKVTGSGESATTTYEDPFLNVTDKDGYEYTYFIKETNKPTGYEVSYNGLDVTNATKDDVTGTVQLKVDKVLTGRSFQRGDKYTYMVTGESKYKGVGVQVTRQNNVIDALRDGISNFVDKLFGSDEIESDADDNIGNIPLPKDKTKEIAPSSGTKESVDFGTIKYTRGDLAKRTIKFEDATDAQKKSARYWTVKTTTGEGEEAVTSSTTYDLTNGKDKAAWDALDDDVKKAATTTIYENVFTYKVMENPMDSAAGDTKPVANDASIKTIVVYALLDQMDNKILVSSELFKETAPVEIEYFATGQDATSKTVSLQPVTFVNVYTSAGEYDPSATKTLNGRPLERDQFDFKWERVAEEVPAGAAQEWAIPEAPLATENPGNGLWDKKDDDKGQDVVKDANADPIGTDSLYGPIDFASLKFTNENLKKKVKYTGTLTDETKNKVAAWEWKDEDNKEFVYGYIPDDAEADKETITVDGETNDDALKYKDATDAQRRAGKSDSLESVWKLDGKTYIAATTENSSILTDAVEADYEVIGYYYEDSRTYTYKLYEVIPDAAMSTATSGDFAGKTYAQAKEIVQAATATPAQRLAFESIEGWTLNGYTYDGVVRTVKVTIKDKGDSEDEDEDGPKDGNIVVTEIVVEKPAGNEEGKLTLTEKAGNINNPLTNFANTYEAEGLVELSIKKKLEGAESATTTPQKAEFTLAKVTSDAPMPDVTKKELVMDPSADNFKDGAWTVKFDDLKFTHDHFMDAAGKNYIATRVKDTDGKGYYERTFVYTVTETAMTAAGNNGVTSDANSKITVAVTVREDDEGNITVVAVNGLDSTAISQDDRVEFSVDRVKATTEGAAHSKVLAGTFTNKYQASGTATLKATKKLYGFDADGNAKELEKGQFEFVLKDNSIQTQGDNKVVHGVTNTVDTTDKTKGTVTFRTLTYNVEDLKQKSNPSSGDKNQYGVAKGKAYDIFTYTIKEVVPERDMIADGYIYGKSKVSDTVVTEKTVSVLVWDKGDGNLGVKYNKEGDTAAANFKESLADDDVTINNLYVGERTFVGTKIWVDGGQQHNNSDELAELLTLYKTTTKPEDWDENTQFTQIQLSDYHIDWTKKTSADDTFTISGLPFDDGEGNRLYYKVVETAPDGYTANHSNKGTSSPAPEGYTDGIASGGTITNVAKVGNATITKKFVYKENGTDKIIPVSDIPAGFKITANYVTISENGVVTTHTNKELTVDMDESDNAAYSYNPATGVHTWTLSRVAQGTKVTADESGYRTPTGYTFTGSAIKLTGDNQEKDDDNEQTFASFTMPKAAATTEITLRSFNPGTSEDSTGSIAFVNNYERDMAKLFPEKEWDDDSDRDGVRPSKVTYKITATNGGTVSEDAKFKVITDPETGVLTNSIEIEISKDMADNANGNIWEWQSPDFFDYIDLPTHTEDGSVQITYTVEEQGLEVLAEIGYTPDEASKTAILAKDEERVISIKNSYTPKTAKITPSKVWDDDSNSAGLRQKTNVYLYKQIGTKVVATDGSISYNYEGSTPVLVGEITERGIAITDTQTIADWENLPVAENGAPIRYTVKENAIKHYTTQYRYSGGSSDATYGTKEGTGDGTDGYLVLGVIDSTGKMVKANGAVEITNKYEPGVRDLEITKFWDDRDNVDGKRPETIKATIIAEFADGSAAKVFGSGPTKTNKKEVTLGIASSGVDKKFTKVDKNTWKWEYEPKKIEDPDNPGTMIDNPDYSGFELPEYVDDKLKATDRDPEGTNGREVFYYVDEETANVPTGYTKVVERTDYGTYKITNSYTPETVEAEITKVWDDDSNINKLRPETLTVELWRKYKDGSSDEGADKFEPVSKDIRDKSIKPLISADDRSGDNNTWKYKVSDLPKNILVTVGTGENAKEVSRPITYFWREAVPANYQATASENTSGKAAEAGYQLADNKATLTNSLDIDLVITKKWLDVTGNKVRPGTTAYLDSLKLYANDDDVTDKYKDAEHRSITDNGDGTYTITWTGLPRNVEGEKQVYYVTETKIDGYDKPSYSNKGNPDTSQASATDKAYNGGVITNKQLIKVDVVKKWNDNDNHDGQRPDKIKVTLYQNGVEYKTSVFPAGEQPLALADAVGSKSDDTLKENDTFVWENAWVDLPYADDNGTPYNYTATETNLDGSGLWGVLTNIKTIRQILLQEWKKVNNEEIKDTLIFRIDNDDTEDKVDFSVDKIWDDANDVDGLRPGDGVKPEKIYFRLYQTIDGQTTSVWTLPDNAKIKFRSNTDDTITDVTNQYTEGYIAVDPKKGDKTQGTLNRVVFENLPKYARVNKGTAENPNWDSVEIEYSVKEDGDVEETAHTPVIDDVKVWKSDKTKAITPYTTAYGGDYEKGITVTNKHETVKDEKEPEAKKAITGRKFKSGDKFTFTIEPVDGAPRPAKDYVTITPTVGQSEYTFKLPKFTFYGSDMKDKIENGDTKVFKYTVTELKGDLEDMTYDATPKTLKITVTRKSDGKIEILDGDVVWGDGSDGADTFTNVYTDTTKLVIRKIWSDDDADGTVLGSLRFDSVNELRPEVIKFKITATTTVDTPALVADGVGFTKVSETEYTKEVTLSKTDDGTVLNRNVWQKTVDGLPKLDAAGEGITYSVDEEQLANYEKPIVNPDGIDDGRWIITNVYKRASFTATKIWDDGNLKHDNATELTNKLKLYRTTADDPTAQGTQWTEVTDKYHLHWNDDGATTADNKYSQSFKITGLPKRAADGKTYTYRVVEDSVGDDYTTTYTNNGTYSSETKALYNGGTVTNTNQGKVTIMAKKEWKGDSEDKSKRQAIKFQLVRTVDGSSKNVGDHKDATATSESFEPIKDQNNDDYVVWKDLPTVVEGKKATYDVKEVSVPDGYTSKVEYGNTDNDNWTETKPNNWNNKIRITNTLNDTAVNVPVRKVWADNDDQDNVRPDSIEVRIYIDANNNGEYDDGEQVKVKDGKLDDTGAAVADLELNDSNNWKRLFKDLPKTDTNGKAVTYKVAEMDDGTAKEDGDTAFDGKYNVSIEGDMASGYVITNSNDPDTVSVTAIKRWYGDADVKEDTRKDVRLLLLGHVSEDREDQLAYVGVDKKIKVDMDAAVETDAGSVTWTGLPKYVDGQEIIWTVIEESVPGYTFSVGQRTGQDGKTTDGKAEFVVTNEYIGSVSEVTATKIWEDGNNRDGKRDDVWFQLYRKIGDSDEEKVGEPKKVAVDETAADGAEAGEVTWTKLPEIIAETIDDGTTEEVYEPVEPAPAVGTEITEEWYEADGSDSYKPTEDETVLEGKTYYTKTTETIKKEMPERSVVYWVKEVNADGAEVAPDGYESTVVQTEPGVFEVRNVHNPETISVFAKKVWNDEEDAEGIRPDHITIRLKADEEKKEDAVITSKADGWNQGESAGDGNSVYEFANLPKYKDGEEIEYSVVELDSDDDTELDGTSGKDKTSYNYTVAPITGSGTAADPYVLINTYNPADEIKLTVTKKWEGDEKVKKTSRKDIELTLIEVVDGARKEKETVTLELPDDVDGEMSYTWDNLDATYKHKAVSYTVEERNIPEGYTASVGDTTKVEGKDNEFTIEVTNTYHEVIPSEDVIYVDPKNASGRMVVKSTTYDSPTEASAAANNKTGKPADPKHKNVRFLGWDVNYDNNGNYVLVATYSDIPSSPTPVVSYIDPQSGKVLVSKQTDDPSSVKAPADPKAKNMQFTGWAVVTDAAGNTMYLAQYECDCSNGNGGKDVDKSNVDTGDDAMLTVWMLLFVMAVSFMVLTMMLRNRSVGAARDTYKPKH